MARREWKTLPPAAADADARSPDHKKLKPSGKGGGKSKGDPMDDDSGGQAGEASAAQKRGDLADLSLSDLLARVVLSDRRGLRELRAGLQLVWILPQDHELYLNGKAAYKRYREAVEKDGPTHTFGSPQPHLAQSCFHFLAKALDSGGRAEEKDKLEALTAPLFADSAALQRTFSVWRWDTAFSPKGEKPRARLTVQWRISEELEQIIITLFEQQGLQWKTGQAPPDGMERELRKRVSRR